MLRPGDLTAPCHSAGPLDRTGRSKAKGEGKTFTRPASTGRAHALLGRASAELGAEAQAVEALRQALTLEPEDALGVRVDLARLGALAPGEAITDGYVRALFDDYAPRFDRD